MLAVYFLQPLVDLEEWLLEGMHSIGLGWGLAIVGLTVLVRLAMVPLTVRQVRAQRRLAPHMLELKRLKERHGSDSERLRREMTAYSREHGVNPLGAFLPVLIQLPIFISLYALMRQDVHSGLFAHAGFLFIPDLTVPAHGVVLILLIGGYMVCQLSSSLIATRTLEGGHRKAAVALPLLFVTVASRFPAGLLVYWITSSLWGLGQQVVLWRARSSGEALAPGPGTGPHPAASPEAPRVAHPVSERKRQRRKRRGR
jgi:YidC/Oxa1 family membrane protein insertase